MAQQCYFLTDDELSAMLDDGYTLIGGPYDTEDDCDGDCGGSSGSGSGGSGSGSGGSGSGGDCECAEDMPDTLYVCYNDLSNGCCWNITLTQSGDEWTGSGDGSNGEDDCGTVTATLSCSDGEWGLMFDETNYQPLIVNSCSPVDFSSTDDDTYSLTVTKESNEDCCSGSGSGGSGGGGSGSGIPCECGSLPDTLNVSTSSSCSCANGSEFSLTWNGSFDPSEYGFDCGITGAWTGTWTVCESVFQMAFVCNCSGVYQLFSSSYEPMRDIYFTVDGCDPLNLVGNYTDTSNALGCGSSAVVTFTITD